MTKDTIPSPGDDALDAEADEWMAECGVKEMVANIAVVFANWASPELLARFREQVEAIMHLSFVEGAIRSRDSLPSPVTVSTPDIEKLRELASEMLAALTALYEACERRANEEGGDFGDVIGPAAELAAAAIAKAAILDSLPSPVSVPEGDDLEDIAYEIAAWIDSDAVDGSARFREIVARRITAALLSAESRGERKAAKLTEIIALYVDSMDVRPEHQATVDAIISAYNNRVPSLSSPEEG